MDVSDQCGNDSNGGFGSTHFFHVGFDAANSNVGHANKVRENGPSGAIAGIHVFHGTAAQ